MFAIRIYIDITNQRSSELEIVRDSTSFNIDKDLWKEVRKVAIDLEMSATDFVGASITRKVGEGEIKEMNGLLSSQRLSDKLNGLFYVIFASSISFFAPLDFKYHWLPKLQF